MLHGAVPGPDESAGSPVGPIVGLVLLVASAVAVAGALRRTAWARPLLRYTGGSVAVGFVLYHGVPFESPVTFPYWGRADAGLVQWLPVVAAVGAGMWATMASAPRTRAAHDPALT